MPHRPWFPFYPSDYLGDTTHLTAEEHGAYILTLCRLWNAGGYLTYDRREMQQLWGMTPQKTSKIWAKISPFFDQNSSQFFSPRLLKEMTKATEISEKRAEAGQKGGLAKATNLLKQNPSIPQPHTTEESKDTPPVVPPKAPRSTRGTRLPNDWTPPPEYLTWARENGNGLDLSLEADKFKDYWIAQPGQKGVKLNWNATWRNWIRNARGRAHAQNGRDSGRRLTAPERVERAIAERNRRREHEGRTFEGEIE